jgi:AcrR family transcriptional regulator
MAARPRPTTRSDAVANRTALLDAATRIVIREGPTVTLELVAAEADLGIATLYRHFPSRDELFAAVVHRSYEQIAELALKAQRSRASAPDALRTFLTRIIASRDRLALPMLGAPQPQPPRTETALLGQQILDSTDDIVQRGIAKGTIRADATVIDVMIAMTMLAHAQLPARAWRTVAGRLATIFVDGLRPSELATPIPPGLTEEQLARAVVARTVR